MQPLAPLDGALLIDKPPGMTSHDVVHVVRSHFKIKKVGHCGTLDPAATGLLVLLLGMATRFSEKFMGSDKIYEGSIRFGESTNSYDADGELVSSLPVPPMTVESLNSEAAAFRGDMEQIPPMVSAVKVGGVPLYKLARKGAVVERKARFIHVYTFRFLSYQEPVGHFRIACTKGTYVRSIAHDLGQRVGCGAHLSSLRRMVSGKFELEEAIKLQEALALTESELARRVIPYLKLKNYE
jgi:tRNA pseudouridine55 synthase